MSETFYDIKSTAQAIQVYTSVLNLKANNIAHVNDEHYSKQTAQLQSQGVYDSRYGYKSNGIEVSELQQIRSAVLDENIVNITALRSSLEHKRSFSRLAEAKFDVDVDNINRSESTLFAGGLGKSINDFFNAFSAFSAAPRDPIRKEFVISSSKALAGSFNDLDKQLKTIDKQVDTHVSDSLGTVNNLLEQIGKINERITYIESGGKNNALEDRDNRQKYLEKLAEYIDFEVYTHPSAKGSIQIVAKDTANNNVTLLNHKFVQNTLQFDAGVVKTNGSSPVELSLSGGSVYGSLEAKNTVLNDLQLRLDDMAAQFVTSVNEAYNPFPSLTGNFFDASGTTAATIKLRSNLSVSNLKASNTVEPGANGIALAVANLQNKEFSINAGDKIDGTFPYAFSQTVVQIGQAVKKTSQAYQTALDTENGYRMDRNKLSSVSLDEEVIDLYRLQKAIEANLRVLKAFKETLDDLVKLI